MALIIFDQINCALEVNHIMKQWIDLGIHTEACMTRPETCGAAGGAISLWMNIIDCPYDAGILSSHKSLTTGFRTICLGSFWYDFEMCILVQSNLPNFCFNLDQEFLILACLQLLLNWIVYCIKIVG